MSNQSIKYGILLTKEQLDFLKDDRQGFHRMTAFDFCIYGFHQAECLSEDRLLRFTLHRAVCHLNR